MASWSFFFAYQTGDGIERIEDEMRFDLHPERRQLRLCQRLGKPRAVRALMPEAVVRIHRHADHDNGAIQDDVNHQIAQKFCFKKKSEGAGFGIDEGIRQVFEQRRPRGP